MSRKSFKSVIIYTLATAVALLFAVAGFLAINTESVSSRVRYNARIELLGKRILSDENDVDAKQELVSCMRSQNSFERTNAASQIWVLGEKGDFATDELIVLLNSSDGFARRASALSLERVGPKANRAIPHLIKAMKVYQRQDTCWFAAMALGSIASKKDEVVLTALRECSESQDEMLKEAASKSLEKLAKQ